jgi:hypothetical protein
VNGCKGLYEYRDKHGKSFSGPKHSIYEKKRILLNDFKKYVMDIKYVEYYELSKEISTSCKFLLFVKMKLDFREGKKLFRK